MLPAEDLIACVSFAMCRMRRPTEEFKEILWTIFKKLLIVFLPLLFHSTEKGNPVCHTLKGENKILQDVFVENNTAFNRAAEEH